jgi:diguanylate cyclase (GGDEF)-like protein/PAS domain S-box-containing protein
MQIRKKLPITIIFLVSVPLIFLGILLYFYTSNTIINRSRMQISRLANYESDGLAALIYAQKKEVQLMAKAREVKDLLKAVKNDIRGDQLQSLSNNTNDILSDWLSESPELQNVFVVNAKGIIISSGNKATINVDVNDREYFHEAIKGKHSVSNVLASKLESKRVIVVASPVLDENGQIIGVLGNTVNVEYFMEYINNITVGESGYAYLVDSEGTIISHPDLSRIGESIENETIKDIINKIRNNEKLEENYGSYTYRGIEKFMGYSIIPEIKWLIVIAQTKSEINEPAVAVLIIIMITTIIFLFLAMISSLKFSKSIINPINLLTNTMDIAATGDLTVKCEYKAKDEFGYLSSNFNTMLDKLNLSYEELTAVYEELSATEEELRAQYDELQQNEEELRNSEEKFRLAVEGANDAIWEWDLTTNKFFASDKWYEITERNKMRVVNVDYILKNIIHIDDAEMASEDLKKHLSGETEFYKSEFRIKRIDGAYKWVLNRGKALRDEHNKPIKLAGSLTDISERKGAEDRITYMAYYDILTKLPNRTLFMERLEKELKQSYCSNTMGAVLFIDLDNFKNTNDTLGHDYGDMLLQLIADKFEKVKNNSDTICRFGGDEFIILQPNIKSEDDVVKLATDILEIFHEVFIINEKQIFITGSIGIALYPRDGTSTNGILKNADTAMYKAKESGKNRYSFFNEEMYHGLERKTMIERILRNALENNELQIHYQPQFDIKSNKITGFEALMRLNSKELGPIPPNEFIPIAEESGLIIEIGEWCLRRVCLKNKEWKDKGYEYGCIAVNISSIQLQQVDFLHMVKRSIKDAELKPDFLEIELTETILMKSLENNVKILNELRSMGVKIALDDFGTGYSSLNYLRKIPITTLKIDKSFIDGLTRSLKEEAIADGIIQIAHKMDLDVVAEGVEFNHQLKILKDKQCDKIQGYLFSKPLAETEVEKILQEYNCKI